MINPFCRWLVGARASRNSRRSSLTRRGLSATVGAFLAGLCAPEDRADHSFTVSSGIYRIPYADGTSVKANNDHHNHPSVPNRVDLGAAPDSVIVAAASGIIRGLVDFNGDDPEEHSCTDDNTVPGDCTDYNNYVWIEHPNGEWTKYTHLQTGSVTGLGWQVGDTIFVGQALGLQGDVGAASGPHLHFEVALLGHGDLTPFSTLGGFIFDTSLNRVTQVCFSDGDTNGDGLYTTDETYTAGPCVNTAPTADAGGPYFVNEGSQVQLNGAASSDPHNAILNFSWSPAENLNDPAIPAPTFSGIDDAVVNLTLTVDDEGGDVTAALALSDDDSTTVTVLNVPPTVVASANAINEGGSAIVSATFTDPGTLDTHTATIDWGDGSPSEAVSIADLAAGVNHVYGDNGSYDVTVTVTDDDNGAGSDTVAVVVSNLAPALALDVSGAIQFPGGNYLVVEAGAELPAAADGSDPGSDDLIFSWSVGEVNTHFNDGVAPDPAQSPFGTFPFAASDAIDAIYANPGVGTLSVELTDDDGGSDSASADVIVTGNADRTEGSGWWKHQYSGSGSPQIDATSADAYRQIVNAVSSVFSEAVAAATSADVHAILSPKANDRRARARAELMVAWLQFASGAVNWNATVPLNGKSTIGFLPLMFDAEETILDANATNAELLAVEQNLARVRQAL